MTLTVRRIIRNEPPQPGYLDGETVHVQQLGHTKAFGRFHVVDEEVIPSHVVIETGALGEYQGPWRSKFKNWIK